MLHMPNRDVIKCDGKIRYPNSKAARTANKKMTVGAEFHGRHYEKLSPYYCTNCGGYHLGHEVRKRDAHRKGLRHVEPYNRRKMRTKTLDNI